MLGFENWEISETLDDIHKKRAHSENKKLIELKTPLEIDNHKLHITEHTKYLLSNLSEMTDTDFVNQMLNHIKEHKKMEKEEN